MLKVLQTQEDQMLGYPFKLIKALAFIHKKLNLSQDAFKYYYEKNHAPLANSLLTLEGYERNYIHNYKSPLFESLGLSWCSLRARLDLKSSTSRLFPDLKAQLKHPDQCRVVLLFFM